MDFSSAAHELYGVTPDAFVETRNRLAGQARDGGDAALAKQIGALRRPVAPAWAVNLLSRSAGEDLGLLLDAGAEMRAAWGSGASIGGLEQRRGELVALLVRAAGRLAADAGHPLRDQAVREVEDTLQAATVDASVADEVGEGRLTRSRSHTGFVPAGFPTGPAEPPAERDGRPKRREARPPAEPKAEPEPKVKAKAERKPEARAEPEAGPGKAARERAARRLAEREDKLSAAQEDAETASAEVARLRRELDRAVTRRDAAARRLERARRARDDAAGAAGGPAGPRHESG